LSLQSRLVEYGDCETTFEGMLAWDDTRKAPGPGVLVCHTIRGRTTFEEGKAKDLARLGYVAMAADVYGASELGCGDTAARSNMDALLADRALLQRRLTLALETMTRQPEVDAAKTAAIGFCFGGLCALDLARIGAPLLGVVSFHGLFGAPGNASGNKTSAGILVLHGWDDPMATPDAVVALGKELSALEADWQIHGYGRTMHAFTNPAASDRQRGTLYDAAADRRSWVAMKNFLEEKLIQ